MITTITVSQWIDSLDTVGYSITVAALWIVAVALVIRGCRK